MDMQEKVIIALAMGIYLAFLIYRNRNYFKKKKND